MSDLQDEIRRAIAKNVKASLPLSQAFVIGVDEAVAAVMEVIDATFRPPSKPGAMPIEVKIPERPRSIIAGSEYLTNLQSWEDNVDIEVVYAGQWMPVMEVPDRVEPWTVMMWRLIRERREQLSD